MRIFAIALFASLLALAQNPGLAPVRGSEATITISGAVEKSVTISMTDLSNMPHRSVSIRDRTGMVTKFDGVPLQSLLELAGLHFGNGLKGDRLAAFLLVEAADDYRVVIALPELDSSMTDDVVLLASHRDGQPLSPSEGPFQIIVPQDKKRSRWVRQVKALRVLHADFALEE